MKRSRFVITIPSASKYLIKIFRASRSTATSALLPTPQAIDGLGNGRPMRLKKDCRRDPSRPGSWRGDLKDHIVSLGLLPTPRANDSEKRGVVAKDKRNGLPAAVIYSQEGFLASHFPMPVKGEGQRMTAISGLRCLGLFENSNQGGSSVKMLRDLLLGATEWYSSRSVLTWKKKVTKSNRLLFQLYPSTLPTARIGFGLLPTARVSDTEGAPVKNAEWNGKSWSRINKKGVRHGVKVKDAIAGIKTGLCLQPSFVEWMMGYPKGWLNFPTVAKSVKQNGGKRH